MAAPSKDSNNRNNTLARFFNEETASGIILIIAAAVALILANSPLSDAWFDFWGSHVSIEISTVKIDLNLQEWVNDLLMVLFFFVVGLEIKRELVAGELSSKRNASLPAIAAFGGVVLPAILYLLITGGSGDAVHGWAIPVATDIAFAVGVLALLGDRVSTGLRVFLLAIAIIDDILAIAIIAIFYTADLDLLWLVIALGFLMVVWGLRKWGISSIGVYVLVGAAVWLAVFQSGVHATIAGVALGLMTPVGLYRGRPIHRKLEERLHPVSAYVVIPIFALANAGVDLRGGVLGESLGSTVTLAIAASLVIGKLVGISTFTLGAIRLGLGSLPRGMRRVQVWGIAALGGIGFTVALFITELSFDDHLLIDEAKVGIFLGSIVAGVVGLVLTARLARSDRPPSSAAESD